MKKIKSKEAPEELNQLKEAYNLLKKQSEETNKLLAYLFLKQSKSDAYNQSKIEFFFNMSHELRTPLNAIIGFSQIMNDELFGKINNKKYKEYIHFILTSSKHLLDVVNDVLDFSKMDANKIVLHEKATPLIKVIKEIVLMLSQINYKKNMIIHQNGEIILMCDEKMLKQILINILSNAIKFTKDNGKIDIFVTLTTFGVSILIKDDGVGIAKSKLAKLFQPFSCIKNNFDRSTSGSGLGLVLVRKMVILHQGRVNMKSTLHKGTTIQVEFPFQRIVSSGDKNEVV